MNDRHQWPPRWFEPERHDLLTPLNVGALAHPVRFTLLQLLRHDGPSTASGLGERIGHSSGVTSYHLRVLAEAELVVEDKTLGNRRDRWWRAAHEATVFSFRVPGQGGDLQDLEAAQRYLRMVAHDGYERVLAYVASIEDRQGELTELPWQLGQAAISLTEEEARDLSDQIQELVSRFRRDQAGRARGPGGPDEEPPEGSAPRLSGFLQYQLVPDPNSQARSES